MRNVNIHLFKLPTLRVCAIILGLASITLSSCSAQRGKRLKDKSIKEWESFEFQEVKKSSDDEAEKWIIYSRKIKGTDFLEYKIEGLVDSPPDALIPWFKQDIYSLASGSNDKKYPVYDIVEDNKDSLLTYVIHNEPFPLKDTEMSVRYIFSTKEDGSAEIEWHEVWGEGQVQPVKKLKRVEAFRGSWNVSPSLSNSFKAVNVVKFNPLKMPSWLYEPMIFKFLKDGLKGYRTANSN
jgi:hypothetical protein